jgi:uncharacterized membrane protein
MVKKIYGYIPKVESEPAYLDDFLPFIESLAVSKRSWISRLKVFMINFMTRWSFKLWMIYRVLKGKKRDIG